MSKIIQKKDKIFLFDLDLTILTVDITEGSKNFIGIVEHLYNLKKINSKTYPTFCDFDKEYRSRLKLNDTTVYKMPYDIYNKEQDKYIDEYWNTTIRHYFRESVLLFLCEKINQGYKIWIVSASPLIYIKPILSYIQIDKIIAIEQNKIINYGIGKVERTEEYVGENLNNIYGFVGDSWNNDGALMMKLKNLHPLTTVKYVLTESNLDKNISTLLEKFQIEII